ncbi:MAG: twin-arginine translocation signal domain-containing protein [Planctomycetota bacterium]|jgi:hypothetical protein
MLSRRHFIKMTSGGIAAMFLPNRICGKSAAATITKIEIVK